MRVALLLLLSSVPMVVRPQAVLPQCESPQTTAQINACAAARAQSAEADMLSELAQLKEHLAKSNPGSRLQLALERAQAEWLRFRHAQCEFAYDYALGGTAGASYNLSCQARLNRARAEELRGLRAGEII
jgi:uncharacterized protein YecT (DUF1311 family)